ncbi:hypothetical protein AQUCO_06100043v1 [Aquilegia coerulea]|uniref:F-box domain-containing protein n=1 Tax=Aquilegia coerulea TaxID=218851 RepID=A0A2G5CD94_AQUCA|nr:hypothetical protein AQUCO_06100043v1 [Aquilegia coerulea]
MLPVRSVLRCRSVCKPWKKIIDDHQFAKLQFTRSRSSLLPSYNNVGYKPIVTSFLFLPCYTNGYGYDDGFYIVEQDKENTNTFNTAKIKFSSSCPPNFSYHCYDQLLYVDGFLCFCLVDGFLSCLCNPATQDWVNFTSFKPSTQLGFGLDFDHINTKFKLAAISYYYYSDGSGGYTTNAQVFTVGSNSSWRDLKNVPQVMCSNFSATVQGSIHWLTHNNDMLSSHILSFDLASENFSFIVLPKCYLEEEFLLEEFHIINFGGDLSVVDFSNNDRVEVWVMKEYSGKESWTKLTVMRKDVVTGVEYIQLFPI